MIFEKFIYIKILIITTSPYDTSFTQLGIYFITGFTIEGFGKSFGVGNRTPNTISIRTV
jgi:hypothetical protein